MTKQRAVKNKIQRRKNNKFKFVLVLAVAVYVTWVFTIQQIEISGKRRVLAQVNADILKQEELSEQLSQKKELVNSPEYLERVARNELGMARPDEIVFSDVTIVK